jgi:hypothetical protein
LSAARDGPTSAPPRGVGWRNGVALALGAVGLLQITGELTGVASLRGIGAATAVSPFPKVFSDVNGLETFASEFIIEVHTPDGDSSRTLITPELYRRLGGPYNRRNVYGAALAYAPRFPTGLWEAVFCYGLAPGGPLRRELGLPQGPARIAIRIRTRTRGRDDTWTLAPSCTA